MNTPIELIFKQYILFVQFSVLQENVPFASIRNFNDGKTIL